MFRKKKNIQQFYEDYVEDIEEDIEFIEKEEERKKKFFFKLNKMKKNNNEEKSKKKSFGFKKKKNIEDEDFIEEEFENKKNRPPLSEKEIFKQRSILFVILGSFFIIVICILLGVFISLQVKDVDIENYKFSNINKNTTVNNETTTEEYTSKEIPKKDESYFNNIRKIRDVNYNTNKNTISGLINSFNQEQEKKAAEENANKEEENKDNSDVKNSSNTFGLPTDPSIQSIITKTNELLEVSLSNATNKCGGLEPLNLSSSKINKLNLALQSKGTTYEKSKLYTLNPDIYNSHLSGYNINDFAVVTEGVLLGDIIYIGNDVQGLKDSDNSVWFGYNLYIK